METKTTRGIRINVEVNYLHGESAPMEDRYCYAYRVTIANEGNESIQVLRRHWIIKDANGEVREVEGEGIVGQQPIIDSGHAHQYVSWCPLKAAVGSMSGTYEVINLSTEEHFDVEIPSFALIYPPLRN